MTVFAFLFLLAAASPMPAPEPISASAIDGISIDITIGALGPGAKFHEVYHRKSPQVLVSDDGATIAQSDLASFVGVLNEPPHSSFDLSRSAINEDVLKHYLDFFERGFLGPNRSNPRIEAEFRKTYLDYGLLKKQCEAGMRLDMFVSDYYPHFEMSLTRGGATVAHIEGTSQREFFVPVLITRDGVETETSDPLVTNWIGALLPKKAPLRFVMYGGDVLANWANFAANTHEMQMLRDGKDSTGPKFRTLFFQNPCGSIGHPYLPYPVDSPSPSPAP